MKKTKFIITLLMAVLMTFSSAFCVSVSAVSSPDEAVISDNYDGIEPIPTEKPEDKPVKHGKGFSSGDTPCSILRQLSLHFLQDT